jgi:polyphosphate kinase
VFRVTRASDLDIAEDEAEDLLSTIEDELRRRDRGEPVRLEMSESTSWLLAERLRDSVGLRDRQIVRSPGPLDLAQLWSVYRQIDRPKLRDPSFTPVAEPRLSYAPTIFRSIREGDILLHHPYDSFRPVVDFLEQAAADDDVVAIKQTLYRTSGDSPVIRALTRAAEAGKEVTALVELKARFDEANNIAWARALEQHGVHVVYGLIGLKTHSKVLLVTRREGGALRRYLHLATGNYNPSTARLYTDLSLFTADEVITHDAMLLFNVLTGYGELPPLQHLVVAPFELRQHVLDRIAAEIEHARSGRPAGIAAKMNSLADPDIIAALYRASQAGVPIDLMVRGICRLRPGIPGVSSTIRVRSILDRFLEHARIFWWKNGGEDLVYSGSADWMPRNLDRRIEVIFPVRDPEAKRRIIEDMFPTEWADNQFSWELGPDGTYARRSADGGPPRRAQQEFMEHTEARSSRRRTTVRPELPTKRFVSPALRVAQAQQRRRGG